MAFICQAFYAVCKDAIEAGNGFYVCLMERNRVYLGPWEGGTWGDDTTVAAWQYFESEEMANAAKESVEKLAAELTEESRKEHGEWCLRTMDWLEARGLEADFLPEPDGPTEYYVWVGKEIPSPERASREYS